MVISYQACAVEGLQMAILTFGILQPYPTLTPTPEPKPTPARNLRSKGFRWPS